MRIKRRIKVVTKYIKKHYRAIAVVSAITLLGGLVIPFLRAAGHQAAVEPESANTSLTGPVARITDSAMSGSGGIRFGPAPPPPGGSAVPAKFVGGYLEYWTGVFPSDIDSRYNLLFHAFATINSNGSVNMNTYWSSGARERLANEYKSWRSQGKPVILSIGGAGGAAAGLTTSAQINNFVSSIIPVIDEFGFVGIDWDLELGVPGGISKDGLVSASRQLKARYGSNFAITMAPFEGYEIEQLYKGVARDLGNDLTFVGFQFYNMDQRVSAANAISRMEDWMSTANLRPDQFSLGFWHGPDDWRRYIVDESLMASVYTAVNNKYPTVRGAWTWAIGDMDRPRNYAFPAALAPLVFR